MPDSLSAEKKRKISERLNCTQSIVDVTCLDYWKVRKEVPKCSLAMSSVERKPHF